MVYEKGYIELIKYLISLDKMDINVRYLYDKISKKIIKIYETVLYRACKSGNLELAKCLISTNKVYINEKNVFIFVIFYHVSN